MDVWSYFDRRERECAECSLGLEAPFPEYCGAAEGSNGQRGIFYGRFTLTERAYLHAFELIVMRGKSPYRERYSFYLIIDKKEIWGYDRDPSHDPSTHRHEGASHTSFPARSVGFKEIANKAWESVSAYEELNSLPKTRR